MMTFIEVPSVPVLFPSFLFPGKRASAQGGKGHQRQVQRESPTPTPSEVAGHARARVAGEVPERWNRHRSKREERQMVRKAKVCSGLGRWEVSLQGTYFFTEKRFHCWPWQAMP